MKLCRLLRRHDDEHDDSTPEHQLAGQANTGLDPNSFDPPADHRVTLGKGVADRIDDMLSPMDGIVASDELCDRLPHCHRGSTLSRLLARFGWTRVYRGVFSWTDIEFRYIEHDGRFFVLDASAQGPSCREGIDGLLVGDGPEPHAVDAAPDCPELLTSR